MIKLLFLCVIIKISTTYTILPIRCEGNNIPKGSDLCWMGIYLDKQFKTQEQNLESNDIQVQRRNSEISSALNFLYGNNKARFPGKRNPEISSALMEYLNSPKFPK